jgi:hypothetical protein
MSCSSPLICSNTSQCQCSTSLSIWHEINNDCFFCLPGWLQWHEQRCLTFAVPSDSGRTFEQANAICQSLSARLLHISDREEYQRFESQIVALLNSTYESAINLFFHLGAWIDRFDYGKFSSAIALSFDFS